MSNKTKSDQLGQPFGTASNKLRKKLLFHLAQKCGIDLCFRCNEKIVTLEQFTIDHKIPWLYSDNPLELFFNLENIAFSHSKCNRRFARKNISVRSNTGFKGVHCRGGKYKKKKFVAVISLAISRIHVGYYSTAEEAAYAYDEAVIKMFGAEAITNKQLGLFNKESVAVGKPAKPLHLK